MERIRDGGRSDADAIIERVPPAQERWTDVEDPGYR